MLIRHLLFIFYEYIHTNSIYIYKILKLFYFYFQPSFFLASSSKGQIQPTCESVTRPEGDGSTGRRLFVFQTYARKRAASDVVDGDVDCKETIMIGNIHLNTDHNNRSIFLYDNSS